MTAAGIAALTATTGANVREHNTISPDGDRSILGLGLSHELWPGMTLAASYAHIWFADGAIEVADAQGTFKGTMSNDLDIVGVSLTGRW